MGQIQRELISAEENTEVEKMLLKLLENLKRLDKAALALGEACE